MKSRNNLRAYPPPRTSGGRMVPATKPVQLKKPRVFKKIWGCQVINGVIMVLVEWADEPNKGYFIDSQIILKDTPVSLNNYFTKVMRAEGIKGSQND